MPEVLDLELLPITYDTPDSLLAVDVPSLDEFPPDDPQYAYRDPAFRDLGTAKASVLDPVLDTLRVTPEVRDANPVPFAVRNNFAALSEGIAQRGYLSPRMRQRFEERWPALEDRAILQVKLSEHDEARVARVSEHAWEEFRKLPAAEQERISIWERDFSSFRYKARQQLKRQKTIGVLDTPTLNAYIKDFLNQVREPLFQAFKGAQPVRTVTVDTPYGKRTAVQKVSGNQWEDFLVRDERGVFYEQLDSPPNEWASHDLLRVLPIEISDTVDQLHHYILQLSALYFERLLPEALYVDALIYVPTTRVPLYLDFTSAPVLKRMRAQLLEVAYGTRSRIRNQLVKHVRAITDDEVNSLAFDSRPGNVDILQYNLVLANREVVKALPRNLRPVFLRMLRHRSPSRWEWETAARGTVRLEELAYDSVAAATQDTLAWLNRNVKLSKAGWRLLLNKLSVRAVARLLRHEASSQTITETLNFLAEVGETPRMAVMSFAREAVTLLERYPTENARANMVAYVRTVLRHTNSKKVKVRDPNLQSEIRHTFDFVVNAELDSNQRRMSFENWLQASRDWHQEIALQRDERLRRRQTLPWESAIDAFVFTHPTDKKHKANGFKVRPLNQGTELAEEGSAMHHCVGGYTLPCLGGRSRIYSIRDKKDKRVATVELVYERDRGWYVRQCYGPCNQQVEQHVRDVADHLCERYREAQPGAHAAVSDSDTPVLREDLEPVDAF